MNSFELNMFLRSIGVIFTFVSWVAVVVVILSNKYQWQHLLVSANAATVFALISCEDWFIEISMTMLQFFMLSLTVAVVTRTIDQSNAKHHKFRDRKNNDLWAFYIFIVVILLKMDFAGRYATYCIYPDWFNYRNRARKFRNLSYKKYRAV